MKLNVDLSLFLSPSGSFGVVGGEIELDFIPRIGEEISFMLPINKIPPFAEPWFKYNIKVENVLYSVSPEIPNVILFLEPIVLDSKDQGHKLSKYFEEGFGLYLDEHDSE